MQSTSPPFSCQVFLINFAVFLNRPLCYSRIVYWIKEEVSAPVALYYNGTYITPTTFIDFELRESGEQERGREEGRERERKVGKRGK